MKNLLTETRKEMVSRLMTRKMTIREIHVKLIEMEFFNSNGEPFSYATIGNDVKELTETLKSRTLENLIEYKVKHLNTLDELERVAWEKGNLKMVLEAVQAQIRLLGTDAPVKTQSQITYSSDIERALYEKLNVLIDSET